MDSEAKDSSQCVRVAVNIRPLITSELLNGCTDCITVVPGEPQVQIGSHAFTYDYVYGNGAAPSSKIFDDCVAPLVDALFHGYNATVLAYGQTGSGKTYTMGTNYNGDESSFGIIPKVMENIFNRVQAEKASTEFLIRVSFIEIFKEEVFDLLDSYSPNLNKADASSVAKPLVPARAPIQIRETVNGGITLAGVTEAEVRTKEEMASYISHGSLSRATGSTNMNSQSSRSHAIFTVTMEQKKINFGHSRATVDDIGDDILCAKLHLVDLAGSERAKRTGADGLRLKEGIHINKGLLSLGNVISALGDEKKRKGGHIPYRDSKLTRLLQDSLGGNSKTVMIACVSPADTNAEETLNTLKYANRARNIQNKAVINRDPMAAQMQRMRSQIEQLQAELLFYRGDSSSPYDDLQILKHKLSLLETSNSELQRELQERRVTCEHLKQCALEAQVEKDKLVMQIESARNGKSWDEIECSSTKDFDLLKTYVSKIQELEAELLRVKNSYSSKRRRTVDCVELDDDRFHSRNVLFPCLNEFSSDCDNKAVDISDEIEDEEELEHSSLQEKFDKELKELDRKLEQKEAEMKRFASSDTSILKQHYEKKVLELEHEKRTLQKEIEELRHSLANISSTSDEGASKLKEEYLQKLNVLEAQVSGLKKKQDAQTQLLRQKQKSDEAAKRLQDEIQKIKSQKVQLQHKIKQESEQFRLWKASREKEVLQLKKEGRRNEYEMHKLLALNQRQKMVLQRKTEEASMATKRLKELLESRKASLRENTSAGNGNGPGIQALMQTVEHELEVTVRVHEVRSEYERQMEERARMANEIAKLKEESQVLKLTNFSESSDTMSPGARNSRIFALENMLATSSGILVSMASQLSEAEERERSFGGRGRWNQIRSLVDAKNIMNYLFNLAFSSRCLLRDKEVDCRERESEIRDLKEKVVKLNSFDKQIETQKAKLIHQLNLQNLTIEKLSLKPEASDNYNRGHKYDLRKLGYRSSLIFSEDMNTSDSENSDVDRDDEWVMSSKRPIKKRSSKDGGCSSVGFNQLGVGVSEKLKLDYSGEEVVAEIQNNESGLCCTCSKNSSCKTNKCQCRASGGICSSSCGCAAVKCSNREAVITKEHNLPQLDMANSEESGPGTDGTEKNQILASQGAMLLQSALTETPAETNKDGVLRRKPLSDIGNTLAKSNAPKPNQRKKWRKSVIQLVPVAPTSTQPENNTTEVTQKSDTSEADVPLKLPRAMHSAASNGSNLLRDRNADQSDELANKETTILASSSPTRPKKASDEKENCSR
ncbi:kinesin-like protein KIN-4C [Mangifera indica]|uniref:kinesin-like protein KIN-4C n=1 Tax=Mangifera indica TaxID=29780 RepID=UPI001CFA7811|nr:kinesin-like protein KIN-4C [Mangifera indica]